MKFEEFQILKVETPAFEEFQILNVETPTYLFEILREKDRVTLVHKKPDSGSCENEDSDVTIEIPKWENQSAAETLELTGNPLEVDLKGDDNFGDTKCFLTRPDNWTEQEMRHYPIDIPVARNLLNTLNNNIMKKEGGENFENATMYCVCNAKDSRKTILLGSDPLTNKRILINIKGCFTETHDEMKVENMLAKHEKNCGEHCEVMCHVSALYSISGWDLKNCAVSNLTDKSRSALLQTSWNKPVYEPCITDDIHLRLQIFAGQIDSQFYQFWEQLLVIQTCIDSIANNSDLEEAQISSNPMNEYEILNHLGALLVQPREMVKKQTVDFKELDMNNLRDEDFMDKFWRLLLRCENVDAIRCCFIRIFEEFAQNAVISYVPATNSTIANILRGILDGTLAVPTITLSQALVFFIELGIEKLKQDYFFIINALDKLEYQEILKEWNNITSEFNKIDTHVAANSKVMAASRKTRMTIAKGAMNFELKAISKLLNCLTGLHMSIEFLHLAKNSNLPEQSFQHITEKVFDKYRPANCKVKFEELQKNRFCEIDIIMCDITTEYLKSLDILFWNMKLTSQDSDSTVTTVFHYSQVPIIPTTIFQDWEIPENEKYFYLHEAIILTN